MNEEKYKMHYEIYEDAYYKSISYLAVGVLIAHLVTYLIIYLIFPLFVFKYNMTLGRRIFKIVTFKDNSTCYLGPKYKENFMEVLNAYGNF